MLKKKILILLCAIFLIAGMPVGAQAATPIVRETNSNLSVYNCYFHYDGKIYVYTTSRYRKEVKKAIRLLNKRFNAFRYTKDKTKRDVLIKDKAKYTGDSLSGNSRILALTTHYNGTILLFKNMFKKMSTSARILTIAHELGHAAGLDHASSTNSLMYPYINKLKAKGLSSADVTALKKARKYADQENENRRKMILQYFLTYEKAGRTINVRLPEQGNGLFVLVFKKRGTKYHSSNKSILTAYQNGLMLFKKPGTVTLKVNNKGTIHRFKLNVRR